MSRLVLVTGAGGKTGRAVVARLARLGPVRAWTRRDVGVAGASEVFTGDLESPADWRRGVEGVSTLYLIAPNMHPRELSIGCNALDAARRAGLDHLVYHSVLHPQTEDMPHHWGKLRVEEQILASGLGFTVLQPAPYMQNLLPYLDGARCDGVLGAPYPPETRLSLVDVGDVAEAAAAVVAERVHRHATYELCGTPPLSQHEVARAVGRALGRAVSASGVSLARWRDEALARGTPPGTIETLERMFGYYTRHGLAGSPFALRVLLGRAPTTLAAFLERATGPEDRNDRSPGRSAT